VTIQATKLATHYFTLHRKNAEALQTLYEQYNSLETMETMPRINEILVWFRRFAGNLVKSLQPVKLFHVRAVATGNAQLPTVVSHIDAWPV